MATYLQRPPLYKATFLQRPFFFTESQYIHSCFNLATIATFFCPQADNCGEEL